MNTAAPDLLLEHHADPYPYYRELRETDPVHWDERRGNWQVMRYDDVHMLLRDEVRLSAEQGPPINMLVSDPPRHTRLRSLVSQAFTPRRIRELRPRIEAIVDELLDKLEGKTEAEVIADFAYPLPITVIGEMMGVDTERRDFFREEARGVALGMGNTEGYPAGPRRDRSALREYFTDLIERRRKDPQDDLVSVCIHAQEDGEQLTEAELHAMLTLLIIGGHETTVNLIGNGLLSLLHNPDQLKRLRDEDIAVPAVEELLRYDSPVQYTGRVAKVDFELRGKQIRAGQGVRMILGSANRDPGMFADPDTLDLTRDPCQHMSFGWGTHYCLGAELARLEGQIALQAFVRRFPDLALATDKAEWRPATVLHGLEALPVTL